MLQRIRRIWICIDGLINGDDTRTIVHPHQSILAPSNVVGQQPLPSPNHLPRRKPIQPSQWLVVFDAGVLLLDTYDIVDFGNQYEVRSLDPHLESGVIWVLGIRLGSSGSLLLTVELSQRKTVADRSQFDPLIYHYPELRSLSLCRTQ